MQTRRNEMTINEMLRQLEDAKTTHGGDCRVRMTKGSNIYMPIVYVGATGKNNAWSAVSRGGVPCVFIAAR